MTRTDTAYREFVNQDDAYLTWLHEHPDGYVLNRKRGKSDDYLVLHRAICKKIREHNQMAQPGGFTSRGYIKVCSRSIESLHAYARTNTGRTDGSFSDHYCRSCKPEQNTTRTK